MKVAWLDTPDDMQWLRDTKIVGLPKTIQSAFVYGNEDYPVKIEVYASTNPSIFEPYWSLTPKGDDGWPVDWTTAVQINKQERRNR